MTFDADILEVAGLPDSDSMAPHPLKKTNFDYIAVAPKMQSLHHRRTARKMARDLSEPATILSTGERILAHRSRGAAEDLLRHNGTALRESHQYGRCFRSSSSSYSRPAPVRFSCRRLTLRASSRMRFRMPRL